MQTCLRRFSVVAVLIAISFFALPHAAFAQAKAGAKFLATDPIIGTWNLNLEKSKFEGARPAPGKRTFIIKFEGDAIRHTTTTLPVGVVGVAVSGGNEYLAKPD